MKIGVADDREEPTSWRRRIAQLTNLRLRLTESFLRQIIRVRRRTAQTVRESVDGLIMIRYQILDPRRTGEPSHCDSPHQVRSTTHGYYSRISRKIERIDKLLRPPMRSRAETMHSNSRRRANSRYVACSWATAIHLAQDRGLRRRLDISGKKCLSAGILGIIYRDQYHLSESVGDGLPADAPSEILLGDRRS